MPVKQNPAPALVVHSVFSTKKVRPDVLSPTERVRSNPLVQLLNPLAQPFPHPTTANVQTAEINFVQEVISLIHLLFKQLPVTILIQIIF